MKRHVLAMVLSWSALAASEEPPEGPTAPLGNVWRVGVNARFGPQLPRTMGTAGLEVRAGAEVLEHLALLVGLSASAGFELGGACDLCWVSGPNSRSTSTFLWASVLLEYAFLDKLLFVALGPAVAYGNWAGTIGPDRGVVVQGALAGLDARLGVTLGTFDQVLGRRMGFTIALGAIVALGGGRYYQPGLQGRDGVYTGDGVVWGLQPAVLLGFDLR